MARRFGFPFAGFARFGKVPIKVRATQSTELDFRPGIRKRVCSKTFARHLVVCTVLFGATLYGWCLVFAGLEPSVNGATYCGLNSDVQVANYNLRELHIFFSFMDTMLCTVVPSVLIMVVNSLSIYRYRQCMKIYSSGVLRVRFLRVPDHEGQKDGLTVSPGLFSSVFITQLCKK